MSPRRCFHCCRGRFGNGSAVQRRKGERARLMVFSSLSYEGTCISFLTLAKTYSAALVSISGGTIYVLL